MFLRASSDDGEMKCTAVLVAPGIALTAAHCVHPHFVGHASFKLSNAAAVDLTKLDQGRWYAVDHAVPSPSFDPAHVEMGHDVAVVFLSGSVANVSPAKIAPWQLPEGWGAIGASTASSVQAHVSGYGRTSADDYGSRRERRDARVPIRGMSPVSALIGDGADGQPCSDDSGGPAMVAYSGSEYVISLASYQRGSTCTTGNYEARLDADWPFLHDNLGTLVAATLATTPDDFPGAH